MTAIAATIFTIPRLSRRARATVLTIHVATSVGWFGLDGALVALDTAGLFSGNAATRAGIAAAMAVIACWVLVPVVFAALVTGLVLAVSTPWGLGRYWWVLAKCGIAAALTAAGLMFLVPQLPALVTGGAEPAGIQTLIARALALILLLVATGLSVVKPWGKTPRGRAVAPAGRRSAKQPVEQTVERPVKRPTMRPVKQPPVTRAVATVPAQQPEKQAATVPAQRRVREPGRVPAQRSGKRLEKHLENRPAVPAQQK